MMQYSSQNSIVDALDGMEFKGNIIPAAWYKTVLTAKGKPDSIAIILLSDIVYWYRPQEVRDEAIGELIGIRKKFEADLLQRSYDQFANHFGYTKAQVKSAVVRLENLGVIRIVFRTLEVGGQKLSNVMFIELIPERLRELTYLHKTGTPLCINFGRGVSENEYMPITISHIATADNFQTNTENTIKNYNKNYPIISSGEIRAGFREQIGYDVIAMDYPLKKGMLDELTVDVLTSHKRTFRVNGEDKPSEDIKDRFRKLNMFHIIYVMDSLSSMSSQVRNIRAVMITAMYNAPVTMDSYYTTKVNHGMKTA